MKRLNQNHEENEMSNYEQAMEDAKDAIATYGEDEDWPTMSGAYSRFAHQLAVDLLKRDSDADFDDVYEEILFAGIPA